MQAVQKVAIGLATPLPVMSKAEPWDRSDNAPGLVKMLYTTMDYPVYLRYHNVYASVIKRAGTRSRQL